MEDKRRQINEKIDILNKASKAYYQDNIEIISNQKYDELYDELLSLENETGIIFSNSPTVNVGYQALEVLPKEEHFSPMLSLDKTKDAESLAGWLGEKEGLLSWKLDGLTVAITYEDGKLVKALTRGNGIIGEVITNNVKVFDNVPIRIPEKNKIIIRGEAIITYSDFSKINNDIEDVDAKYKNPRNLSSGTVRQLNNEITANRHVNFYAFSLVSEETGFLSREEELTFLKKQGFTVVEYHKVNAKTIVGEIKKFKEKVLNFDLPTDGLVLIYDDIKYGKKLGSTAKFPRDAIAFKWEDEIKTTRLIDVEWNVSRTGLINPIAVFEPVELEGTTVGRATVHNLSIVKELRLGMNDEVNVYKANMIIPQIAENLTMSGTIKAPLNCPVCGYDTEIKDDNGIETVYCKNPRCPAKKIKSYSHFVSRNALNIEGLSEATLEKFINKGIIKKLADIFNLADYKDEIVGMEGFGEKSYENIIKAVSEGSKTTPTRLLFALGVPNIGTANAKMIAKKCHNNWQYMMALDEDELNRIDGIGPIMAKSYVDFFQDQDNKNEIAILIKNLKLNEEYIKETNTTISGVKFVITGSLNNFGNRDELKEIIESKGGKVSSSVSKNTDYLINNDTLSNSSKNKKANELGVKIISEDEFMNLI